MEKEFRKIVTGDDIQNLVGRLLTIIDATVEGDEVSSNSTAIFYEKSKKSAIKDLIKSFTWDWAEGIPPEE